MDITDIQLWGVLGTWVASIGTVSAVIVSLWLAYNREKINLKIRAYHDTIYVEINSLAKKQPVECCAIIITNTGNKPVKIRRILWSAGKVFLPEIFESEHSAKLPKIIDQGDDIKLMLPFGENNWIINFPKLVVGNTGKEKHIKQLRVIVNTSVGKVFKMKVENDLVEALLKSYRDNKSESQKGAGIQ